MDGCWFDGAKFNTTILNKSRIVNSMFRGAEVKNCELNRVNFHDSILDYTQFSNSILNMCYMPWTSVKNVLFINMQIDNTNFEGTDLSNSKFYGSCTIFGSTLNFSYLNSTKFYNGSIRYSKFKGSTHLKTELVYMDVSGCNFQGATIKDGSWIGNELNNCDFSGTDFRQTKFNTCIFTDCTFRRTNFDFVDLSTCTFKNCNFNFCNLRTVKGLNEDELKDRTNGNSFYYTDW